VSSFRVAFNYRGWEVDTHSIFTLFNLAIRTQRPSAGGLLTWPQRAPFKVHEQVVVFTGLALRSMELTKPIRIYS
jgi:hypothetical protein